MRPYCRIINRIKSKIAEVETMQIKECLYYFWYSGYSRYLVTIWYLLRTLGSSTFTMGSSLSLPQACPQMCNSEQVEGLKIWGWGQTLLVEQTANVLWLKSVVLACLFWKHIYFEILGKRWFPYYKHVIILSTLQ